MIEFRDAGERGVDGLPRGQSPFAYGGGEVNERHIANWVGHAGLRFGGGQSFASVEAAARVAKFLFSAAKQRPAASCNWRV